MTKEADALAKYGQPIFAVDFKKPWVYRSSLFLPLRTIEQRYLLVVSEGMAREIAACNKPLLHLDNVRTFPPRKMG